MGTALQENVSWLLLRIKCLLQPLHIITDENNTDKLWQCNPENEQKRVSFKTDFKVVTL